MIPPAIGKSIGKTEIDEVAIEAVGNVAFVILAKFICRIASKLMVIGLDEKIGINRHCGTNSDRNRVGEEREQ